MSGAGAYVRRFTGFERDARVFLVATLVAGAATSLYWIDFNLYLAALGLSPATIGIVATVGSVAAALVAFPASAASDRVGRRAVLAAGVVAMALAVGGFVLTPAVPAIVLLAALYGAGQQTWAVVQMPFLTEHSRPEHRNELFALQFAISNATQAGAAIIGALAAASIARLAGLAPGGASTYRVILVLMGILFVAAVATLALLGDDRPRRTGPRHLVEIGEPAAFPSHPHRRSAGRFGLVVRDRGRFVRLVLPGFLISLGAGQVIPFLNLFVQRKFGLSLESLNAAFALTSLGTVVAILVQPALARRLGKLPSVVVVQGASIPFLVVLGFSPILWTVVVAMAVRNSLMNAGNPIFNAFAMEQMEPAERATLAAAMSLLWSLGWVIAGPWYSVLQATLGFATGYAVNFVTIITLYSIATGLYWAWFRNAEARGQTAVGAVA